MNGKLVMIYHKQCTLNLTRDECKVNRDFGHASINDSHGNWLLYIERLSMTFTANGKNEAFPVSLLVRVQ